MLVGTGSGMSFSLSLPEDTEDLVRIEPGKLPKDVIDAFPDWKNGVTLDLGLSRVYAVSPDGVPYVAQVTLQEKIFPNR